MNQSKSKREYYQNFSEPLIPGLNARVAKTASRIAKWCLIAGVILLIIAYAPSIWYLTSSDKIANITQLLANTATKEVSNVIEKEAGVVKPGVVYQPKKDTKLPVTNMITIPSVNIDTQINEASFDTYEEALQAGVWRVPDFGTPYNREFPTIMAAHRYGYLKWSIPYRLKNSFYSLPKLEVGDIVEITWRQREYVYEVYAEEKEESITDYEADLILYTCESLNSSVRIIKYARLLEI